MNAEQEEKELVEWFKDDLLPKLLRDGRLPTGKHPKIEKCDFKMTDRFTDHFASCPYFLKLTVDSDDGRKEFDLLVKFFSQDDRVIECMNVERQFRNEVKMYNDTVEDFRELLRKNPKSPQGLVDDIIPKCYYAHYDGENPKRSVLVFENLRQFRYSTAESKVFLDYEHCAEAMTQAARFHSLSLSMKIKYPELLERVKTAFVECRYFESPSVREQLEVFNHTCNQRAVDYLLSLEDPKVPKEYVRNFRKLISEPFELIQRMVTPREPLALLCHGDFCRNNMLFLYEDGRVIASKIFDFQTSRYASPAIDLAFFLYLNTTQELRDRHFDDLLELYYSTLVATTATILDVSEKNIADRFPRHLFMEDFAQHAVYAYFHVSFFLALMSESCEIDWDDSLEQRAQHICTLGGEEVSKRIADVIFDFYRRKFYVPKIISS